MQISPTCKTAVAAAAVCAVLGAGLALAAVPAQAAVLKVPAGATYSFDGSCGDCHVNEVASYAAADEATETDAADTAKDAGQANASGKAATVDAAADPAAATASADAEAPAATEACMPLLQVSAHQAFSCTSCHDDQEAMDDIHKDVAEGDRIPKRLKNSEVDDQVCLTCHESYEALAEKTADSEALVDTKGTVVNPHEVTEMNEKHLGTFDCFSCHEAHGEDAVADKAARTCESCHHVNVYECYTCHD